MVLVKERREYLQQAVDQNVEQVGDPLVGENGKAYLYDGQTANVSIKRSWWDTFTC